MEPVRLWCRVRRIGADGNVRGSRDLWGAGRPDLATIEEIARLALEAGREEERLLLQDVEPAVAELIRLAALPVEVEGQSESGKEPFVVEEVEEEGHLGDLPI